MMLNLFNPWVWIGVLFVILGAATAGYSKGENDELMRQQAEIAALNAEARQKEQALVAAVNTQAVQLVKANNEAKVQIKKRDADIAAGVIRLRIPVSCPVQASGDSELTSRSDTGSAEIQPETSRAILAIGDEADNTVRKLNACITLYNQAREMINERK